MRRNIRRIFLRLYFQLFPDRGLHFLHLLLLAIRFAEGVDEHIYQSRMAVNHISQPLVMPKIIAVRVDCKGSGPCLIPWGDAPIVVLLLDGIDQHKGGSGLSKLGNYLMYRLRVKLLSVIMFRNGSLNGGLAGNV